MCLEVQELDQVWDSAQGWAQGWAKAEQCSLQG
jgi:hypothetical protein